MEFDRTLSVGANGDHGPIRYFVETYKPGYSIKFRFTGPRGFEDHHGYEIVSATAQSCVLRHTLEMTTHGSAMVSWPVVFRPMHDALIEDSLAVAQASLGHAPRLRPWSAQVWVLRWVISGGRARPQVVAQSDAPKSLPPRHGKAAIELGRDTPQKRLGKRTVPAMTHIALFEAKRQHAHGDVRTIAFRVDGLGFLRFLARLTQIPVVPNRRDARGTARVHRSWQLLFRLFPRSRRESIRNHDV
jgi:hypothetical protein